MEGGSMKMKTRWASYILALVLALSFGSLPAAAQEKTTGGKPVTLIRMILPTKVVFGEARRLWVLIGPF